MVLGGLFELTRVYRTPLKGEDIPLRRPELAKPAMFWKDLIDLLLDNPMSLFHIAFLMSERRISQHR